MSKSADGLNQVLANATVLYQKLRAYHWYVKGHKFFELHRLGHRVRQVEVPEHYANAPIRETAPFTI